MFRYSLEGSARQWCISLSPSRISSLKEFNAAFHNYFKRYFSDELPFENYCGDLESILQHKEACSTDSEQEMKIDGKDASFDKIQEDTFFSPLLVAKDENIIEVIFSPFKIDEIALHSFVFQDDIVVVKEIYFQGFVTTPVCNKTFDIYELFQEGQV